MRITKKFILKLSILTLILGSGITFFSQTFDQKIKGVHQITILHTNDHHGHFWETEKDEWGMAARATLIKQIRQEVSQRGGSVLLLSGGDINTGTPESDMANAFPDFIGMRYMKYDAMAIGNHEFDNQLEVILQQQAMAGFPFLSANLYYKGTDQRPFSPYKIMDVAGLRVGILGLTTDESPQISLMFPKETLELKSPINEAKKLVPELKNKVDLLLAVTHMGHYKDGKHGSSAPGDVTLARTVKGIDVIVGGHSQNPLFTPDFQNGTYILQAEDFGKYLGRMDIEVSSSGVKLLRSELIPINHLKQLAQNKIPKDQKLHDVLKPYKDSANEVLGKQIGKSLGPWQGERSVIRRKATNLGNLVTEAMREATEADVAVLAGGTIRDNLPQGNINLGHLMRIQPFSSTVDTVTLTGAELREYLSVVVKKTPGDGAFPQMSGLKLDYDVTRGKLTRVQIEKNKRFEELDDSKSYVLVTNSFHSAGGGGYPVINEHPNFKVSGKTDSEVLGEYIQKHSPIDPSQYAEVSYFKRQ